MVAGTKNGWRSNRQGTLKKEGQANLTSWQNTALQPICSRDDEHPELPPVPAGDARVGVEVGHLELAAPGVGRRPEVVGDAGHLQRRQLRQAALGLHRRLLERDLDARGPCIGAGASVVSELTVEFGWLTG